MRPLISIFLWIPLVLGIVGSASHSPGKENEDEKATLYTRLVKASGIEAQLKGIPKSLLSVIPADIFPNARTKTRIENLYLKAFGQTDSTSQCLVRSLTANLSEIDVSELLRFYESRVGRKVARLQERSLDPVRLREMREGYRRVTMLEEPRLSLMKRLAENQRRASTNVAWTRALIAGLMAGYTQDDTGGSAAGRDVGKIIEYGTKIALEKSEDMRMLSAANTFESLSNDELSEAVTFFDSEAAAKMQEAIGVCIRAGLFHAAWTLGSCFREGTAPSSRPQ